VRRRRRQVSLAEVVDRDVEGGQEGVRVGHGGSVPGEGGAAP
jgi:hypothetical protein